MKLGSKQFGPPRALIATTGQYSATTKIVNCVAETKASTCAKGLPSWLHCFDAKTDVCYHVPKKLRPIAFAPPKPSQSTTRE